MAYEWAALLAIGAAASYAAGAVLQQHAAFPARGTPAERPATALALRGLVARPLWLAGVGLDGVGFLFEFAALRAGSVTFVQPLLVCGLLFALPLGALLARRRVRAAEIAAGALVCVGLAAFLIAAQPRAGREQARLGTWLIVCTVALVVVGAAAGIARGRTATLQAALFAAAAGVVNAVFAGLAKSVGGILRSGLLAVALSWQVWALVAAAVLTLSLAARAFQAGAAVTAITALFVTEPLAGIAVGAVVFGETVRQAPGTVVVQIAGLAVCLAGVALLARSPAVAAAYAPH